MMNLKKFAIFALACQLCSAFVAPMNKASVNKPFALEATADKNNSIQNSIIASSIIMAATPLVSKALEDNYEYGAVDAPIGLAWGVGVLAIATAAVPIFLKGGEEALEEMREREGNTFGKGGVDLGKKKRR